MDVNKLKHAAVLARSDLARGIFAVKEANVHIAEQQYQSIRLITLALGDESKFENTWNRWIDDGIDPGKALKSFHEVMTD